MHTAYPTISRLLILLGIFAIIFPRGLVDDMMKSYTVPTLIQGWGIYAVTVGLLLLYPTHTQTILFACFFSSIIWHMSMAQTTGYTKHHIESIVVNSVAIIGLFTASLQFHL